MLNGVDFDGVCGFSHPQFHLQPVGDLTLPKFARAKWGRDITLVP
jgi:hypothetical protein